MDQIIDQYCPPELTYEKSEDDTSVIYTFTLSFQSFEDYKAKAEAILGRESEMVCRQPDSVFSSGVALEEDFDSRDLLGWFQNVVEENRYMSDSSNLWELSGTRVFYGEEEFSSGGTIRFDRVVSNPVSAIHMRTVCGGDRFDRTIVFDLPAAARDTKRERVDAYMDSLVPADGEGVWETFSDGYQYTITFSESSFEDLAVGMTRIFGGAQLYTEISGDDPFVKIQTVEEYFTVYDFGDTANGALRFDSEYIFEDDENRYIQSGDGYGSGESAQYVWTAYTGEVGISFRVVDRSAASGLDCMVILNKEDAFDVALDICFPAGRAEEALRAANYYRRWDDIAVETLTQDGGEICRINLLSGHCPVVERLNAILGSDDNVLSVTTEKGLFKSECEIETCLDFCFLAERAGFLNTAANYTLSLESYKLKNVNWDGYNISEASAPFSLEGVGAVYLTAAAEKMNPGAIFLALALAAAALAAVFAGFTAFIKRMAARDCREDGALGKLTAVYSSAVLALVKEKFSFAAGKFGVLLRKAGPAAGYYPEGANRRLMEYFYGSRWPFWILLIGLICLPAAWFILRAILTVISLRLLNFYGAVYLFSKITSLVHLLQMLSIPVSLIWLIADKVRVNPVAEAEYDRVFQDDLEKFRQSRGLEQLCLTPEQVALAEPLKLVRPDYGADDPSLPPLAK